MNLRGGLDDVDPNDARAGNEAVGELNILPGGSTDRRVAALGDVGACDRELAARTLKREGREDLPLLAIRVGS